MFNHRRLTTNLTCMNGKNPQINDKTMKIQMNVCKNLLSCIILYKKYSLPFVKENKTIEEEIAQLDVISDILEIG